VAFEEPETGLSAGFKGVKSGSEDTDESLLVMEVGARNLLQVIDDSSSTEFSQMT
jgi:hypothetical protein